MSPVCATLWLLLLSAVEAPTRYDLVIHGGRVMDPETGVDAVRDVGIRGGNIARISAEPLQGARTIDATGLVVAPGFIDLHQHQHDAAAYRLKALDGVATALELEIGVPDVKRFLEERRGRSLIHHGTSASHPAARVAALGVPMTAGALVPPAGPATDTPTSPEEVARIEDTLRAQIRKDRVEGHDPTHKEGIEVPEPSGPDALRHGRDRDVSLRYVNCSERRGRPLRGRDDVPVFSKS